MATEDQNTVQTGPDMAVERRPILTLVTEGGYALDM